MIRYIQDSFNYVFGSPPAAAPTPAQPAVIDLTGDDEPALTLHELLQRSPEQCYPQLEVGSGMRFQYLSQASKVSSINLVRDLGLNFHGAERLAPGKWLNDECINTFVERLCLMHPQVHSLSSFLFQHNGFDGRVAKVRSEKLRAQLHGKDKVVIPCHNGSDHWFAIMIDGLHTPTPTVYCADGLNYFSEHKGYHDQALQLLKKLYPTIKPECVSLQIPHQGNAVDCGVVCGVLFDLFAQGELQNFLSASCRMEDFDYGPYRSKMAVVTGVSSEALQRLK